MYDKTTTLNFYTNMYVLLVSKVYTSKDYKSLIPTRSVQTRESGNTTENTTNTPPPVS